MWWCHINGGSVYGIHVLLWVHIISRAETLTVTNCFPRDFTQTNVTPSGPILHKSHWSQLHHLVHHGLSLSEPCTMGLVWQLHVAVAPMVMCSATCQACGSNVHAMNVAASVTRRTGKGWRISSTSSPMPTSWSTSGSGSLRSSVPSCRIWWRSKGENCALWIFSVIYQPWIYTGCVCVAFPICLCSVNPHWMCFQCGTAPFHQSLDWKVPVVLFCFCVGLTALFDGFCVKLLSLFSGIRQK